MRVLIWCAVLAATFFGGLVAAFLPNYSFPNDSAGTLSSVKNHVMRVGYSFSPPWVKGSGKVPLGIEPSIVASFAKSINARIEWIQGSEQQLFEALKRHEIDILIAGITDKTPWKDEIGLTLPYAKESIYIGIPQGYAKSSGNNIKNSVVAVRKGTDLAYYVRKNDNEVLYADSLPLKGKPAVGYDWELREWGLTKTGSELKKENRVIAVPPGENAWLSALDSYLLNYQKQIERLLK